MNIQYFQVVMYYPVIIYIAIICCFGTTKGLRVGTNSAVCVSNTLLSSVCEWSRMDIWEFSRIEREKLC
jgi:hypothetical protein